MNTHTDGNFGVNYGKCQYSVLVLQWKAKCLMFEGKETFSSGLVKQEAINEEKSTLVNNISMLLATVTSNYIPNLLALVASLSFNAHNVSVRMNIAPIVLHLSPSKRNLAFRKPPMATKLEMRFIAVNAPTPIPSPTR